MSEIASYTATKYRDRRSTYRGAIRRTTDNGVIWECEHEHIYRVGSITDNGPVWCAQRELERRAAQAHDAGEGA